MAINAVHSVHERTEDSRFLLHHLRNRGTKTFHMYSENLQIEGDGLPYFELVALRALLLYPLNRVILNVNMKLSLSYNGRVFFHAFGLFYNVIRVVASLTILLIEIPAFLLRLVLGYILYPVAIKLTAGHIYALPLAVIHSLISVPHKTSHCTVDVAMRSINSEKVNAGWLGPVTCFEAKNFQDASYIAAIYMLQQRGGGGPEVVCIRDNRVFVSMWRPLSISALFSTSDQVSWKLMDPVTYITRHVVVTFKKGLQESVRPSSSSNGTRNTPPQNNATPQQNAHASRNLSQSNVAASQYVVVPVEQTSDSVTVVRPASAQYPPEQSTMLLGRHSSSPDSRTPSQRLNDNEALRSIDGKRLKAFFSNQHLGTMDKLEELEELYNSPRGWNKYHKMRAVGTNVQVTRNDRRALGHLMALVWSLLIYWQFRDPKEPGWFGSSVDLYALVLANYAFITTYAAELLTGPVNDVTDAKSGRYGVICTRAIDSGFVRGFHVPGGHWLNYKNGDERLPWYTVTKTEVNVTCDCVMMDSSGTKVIDTRQ